MPTYDYQCRSCGVITEVVHSMLDDGPSKCERCGGELRRLVHPTGIIFRGSGFYKTDSRSSASESVGGGGGSGSTTPAGDTGSTATSSDSGSKDKASPKSSSGGDAAKGSAGND